jgi:nitrogen fixation-related uncharacterized protein
MCEKPPAAAPSLRTGTDCRGGPALPSATIDGDVSVLASAGGTAEELIITISIVVPLVVLAIVIWFFWRAAGQFDAEQRQAASATNRSSRPRT